MTSDVPRVDSEVIADDVFLTKQELAQRLGVHERTLERWIQQDQLPPPCLGHGGRPRWLWSFVVGFCRQTHGRQGAQGARVNSKLT